VKIILRHCNFIRRITDCISVVMQRRQRTLSLLQTRANSDFYTEFLNTLIEMHCGISCGWWKRSSVGRVSLALRPVCGLPIAVQWAHHKSKDSGPILFTSPVYQHFPWRTNDNHEQPEHDRVSSAGERTPYVIWTRRTNDILALAGQL